MSSTGELLRRIMEHFNPSAAAGWNRTIQFELRGEGGGVWHLVIEDQKCTVREGETSDADIKISMNTETFRSIVKGEMSGIQAYMYGKISVDGSLRDLMKLRRLFPKVF